MKIVVISGLVITRAIQLSGMSDGASKAREVFHAKRSQRMRDVDEKKATRGVPVASQELQIRRADARGLITTLGEAAPTRTVPAPAAPVVEPTPPGTDILRFMQQGWQDRTAQGLAQLALQSPSEAAAPMDDIDAETPPTPILHSQGETGHTASPASLAVRRLQLDVPAAPLPGERSPVREDAHFRELLGRVVAGFSLPLPALSAATQASASHSAAASSASMPSNADVHR